MNTTVILGSRGSGKTTLALKLVKSKKYIKLEQWELKSSFCFKNIEPDTEAIIIDECTDISPIDSLLKAQQCVVEKQAEWPFIFEIPELVIVSSNLTKNDFSNYLNLNVQILTLDIKPATTL